MKGRCKNRKVLIGSISLASAIVLLVASFGPSLLFSVQDAMDLGNNDSTESWNIIVPDQYDNIQDAIDNAKPGDRIFVRSGRYGPRGSFFLRLIRIETQGLTICGENKNTTIINGRGASNPVYIDADHVSFSGFTITNNGINGSLMKLYSNHCNVENNVFIAEDYYDGTEYGIKMYDANENTISNNRILGADKGIDISGSNNNIIENNTIEDNDIGIDVGSILTIDFSRRITKKLSRKSSCGNIFRNNVISDNREGFVIDFCDENYILNNTIFSNNRFGLIMSRCSNNIVKNNEFTGDGVELWGSEISHFIHDIQGNKVNDKPLYYFNQKNDFTVPSDAGQIIIVDCDGVTIEHAVISDTSTAVLIVFSSNVYIEDNEFSSNYRGIFLYYSKKCSIKRNNFIDNRYDARFISLGFFNSKSNVFRYNYWDSWIGTKSILFSLTRKRIHGRFHLNRRFRVFDNFIFGIRTRNFDRSPAKQPYEI